MLQSATKPQRPSVDGMQATISARRVFVVDWKKIVSAAIRDAPKILKDTLVQETIDIFPFRPF